MVLACGLSVPSFADSQARIVRLSQVDGDVQIDRAVGRGYEKAFINLPITQGARLRTGSDARAEIEFEDGTTLRVTPGTVVEISELARRDSGARSSGLNLQTGTAYLNFKADKSDQEFWLEFGHEKLALTKPAHLRLELKDSDASLAVFKGDVQVEGASSKVEVEKKHSASFDLTGTNQYTLSNNLEPDPYDDWDKQQDKYHEQYSASASNSYSPNAFGASDLNYYGSFYNMPGYGMMWQPYLAGAGWDPFMNGAWTWYPGSGYAWISAYPWGWMPYRYGSWTYLNSYGWFWQPGAVRSGWNTTPLITNPPRQFVFPRPPSTPGQTLLVNRGTLSTNSGAGTAAMLQNRTLLRNGTAGLGVARGSVRDLGKVSRQVEGSSRMGTAARLPAAAQVSLQRGTTAPRTAYGSVAVSQSSGSGSRTSAPASRGSGSPSPHR
jgi:hypothetical protein